MKIIQKNKKNLLVQPKTAFLDKLLEIHSSPKNNNKFRRRKFLLSDSKNFKVMFSETEVSNSSELTAFQKDLKDYARVVTQLKYELAKQHQRVMDIDFDSFSDYHDGHDYHDYHDYHDISSQLSGIFSESSNPPYYTDSYLLEIEPPLNQSTVEDISYDHTWKNKATDPVQQALELLNEDQELQITSRVINKTPKLKINDKERNNKMELLETRNLTTNDPSEMLKQQYDKILVLKAANQYLRYKLKNLEGLMHLKQLQLQKELSNLRGQLPETLSEFENHIVDFKIFRPNADLLNVCLAGDVIKNNVWVDAAANFCFAMFVLIGVVLSYDELYG